MQPCVIDSCSLLHAFHLTLGGFVLADLVAEHFAISLHPTVLQEMRNAFRRAYPTWKERGLVSEEASDIRRTQEAWVARQRCGDDVSEAKDQLKGESLAGLDAGEIDCIALSKFTSDDQIGYVLFLTDDYDAGEQARHVFDKYQCGMVVRSADLIMFFGIRYGLAKQEIHQALRSLLAFYTSTYDLLLKEVRQLLPGNDQSYVYPLIYAGHFANAKQCIARLSLTNQTKGRLGSLLNEMSRLSDERSVVAHSVSRLRSLQSLHS